MRAILELASLYGLALNTRLLIDAVEAKEEARRVHEAEGASREGLSQRREEQRLVPRAVNNGKQGPSRGVRSLEKFGQRKEQAQACALSDVNDEARLDEEQVLIIQLIGFLFGLSRLPPFGLVLLFFLHLL